MAIDFSNAAGVLLSGYSIALYEFGIFASYSFLKFIQPWGKVINIEMKKIGGIWFARKPRYLSPRVKAYKGEGKEEAHYVEPELAAYIAGGGIFSNPVTFTNIDDTRPLVTTFDKVPGSKSLKANFKRIDHNPKTSPNPSAAAFKGFVIDEDHRQAKAANRTNQKFPWGFVVFGVIAGICIGALIGYVALPPHVIYQQAQTITGVATTTLNLGTNSSAVATSTHTIINGGTQTVSG